MAAPDEAQSAAVMRTSYSSPTSPTVRVPSGSFAAAPSAASGGAFFPSPTSTAPIAEAAARSTYIPPRPPRAPVSPAIELALLPGSPFPAPPTSAPHRRPASNAVLRASTAGLPVDLQAGTPPPLPHTMTHAPVPKAVKQYRPYSPPVFQKPRASLPPPPAPPPPSRVLPPLPRSAALGAAPSEGGWHVRYGGDVVQRRGLERGSWNTSAGAETAHYEVTDSLPKVRSLDGF